MPLVKGRAAAKLSLACLIEAIDYSLRPQLSRLGGDLWLDEVDGDRYILGFRAPQGEHDDTLAWLAQALESLFPGATSALLLRDYTARQV